MKKIIILGSKGMLGQMVKSYFSKDYSVVEINNRYSLRDRDEFLNEIKEAGEGIIINCIGKIKQKTDDPASLVNINSVLPIDIYNSLGENQYLIQPSTDCVFNGNTQNWYSVTDTPNAIDDYGWSKRLGEVSLIGKPRAFVIRVSIIGPDKISPLPKGLLGWFLGNEKGSVLKGYTNHFWNGITTLEWCKKVNEEVIVNDSEHLEGKVTQFGTLEKYSKYDMLNIFQQTFNTDFSIQSFETEEAINRCLEPEIISKSLEQQLVELKNYQLTYE